MYYWIAVIIRAVIWGMITKKVSEKKGYYGGFAWGFWLGLIGLIVVACKSKQCRSDDYYATSSFLSAVAQEESEEQMLSNGGWKCKKCGRVNTGYTGTCSCGMTKEESKSSY